MPPNPDTVSVRRARNRAFITEINARIFCAHCGAQPVEWHNPEHVELNRQNFRISSLVARCSALAAIQNELDRCTPLCRRCHMREDGRLKSLKANQPRQAGDEYPPKPCQACGRLYKPLRRRLCSACEAHLRRCRHTDCARCANCQAARNVGKIDCAAAMERV